MMKYGFGFYVLLIGVLFANGPVVAEPLALSFSDLPTEIRSLAQDTRRNCKEQGDEGTYDDMQGISAISFEDGSRGLIIDSEHLCNSWIKAGNCSNRGVTLRSGGRGMAVRGERYLTNMPTEIF